jgi:hypothetical protein
MSANVYTIEEALKGTFYRSKTLTGTIEYAEKRDDVFYSNAEAYLVTIRPDYGYKTEYRTIAVQLPN